MKKNFQPFYDRPETIEYKSTYIGNNYGTEYEIKKSTFNSVSEYSDVNKYKYYRVLIHYA